MKSDWSTRGARYILIGFNCQNCLAWDLIGSQKNIQVVSVRYKYLDWYGLKYYCKTFKLYLNKTDIREHVGARHCYIYVYVLYFFNKNVKLKTEICILYICIYIVVISVWVFVCYTFLLSKTLYWSKYRLSSYVEIMLNMRENQYFI